MFSNSDDTADDIAEMGEVADEGSPLGQPEGVSDDARSVDNDLGEDFMNDDGSDMYTDADRDEPDGAEHVEGRGQDTVLGMKFFLIPV
jgi:hypothetical protein